MTETLKSKAHSLRREHILAAAVRVFAEKGYRGSTIRDVATAAGVADGTIYNAFANKAELLLSLIEPLADRPPDRAGGSLPTAGEDALAAMLRDRLDALTGERLDMLRVVLSEALIDAEIRKLFYGRVIAPALDPLRAAIAQSPGGWGGRDPELVSRTIVASVLGLAVLRMLGDGFLDQSWPRVAEELASLVAPRRHPGKDE